FDGSLAPAWSASAPGDNAPGGAVAVNVDSESAPGAAVRDGALHVIESGAAGDRWLSTSKAFDWTPAAVGGGVPGTLGLGARAEPRGQARRAGRLFPRAPRFPGRRADPGGERPPRRQPRRGRRGARGLPRRRLAGGRHGRESGLRGRAPLRGPRHERGEGEVPP